jgi:hypothetical protein
MTMPVDLDYRARRVLVRPVLDHWLGTLPGNCKAEHVTTCPACGGKLTMRRDKSPAPGVKAAVSARCSAPFCVKL